MTYEANNRSATVVECRPNAHHRFEVVRVRNGKRQVSAWAPTAERANAIAQEWVA